MAMTTCEFCQAELPEDAVFCGQCGRKVRISGETSISAATTPGLITPVLGNWTMPPAGQTPYPLGPEPLQKARSGEQRPFIQQDSGIHQTLPAAAKNNQDDESRVLPFFPIPPAPANGPMVQGMPQPGGGPFVHNAPQMAGNLGQPAQAAFSGPPPSYTQPAYPFSPQNPPLPAYSPQPPTPPRWRLPHALRPTCLVIVALVLVATSIIVAFTQIFFPHGPVTPSAPRVALAGTPAPGQSIILYGNNFTPGETVIISIDTRLQTSTRNGSLGSLSQGIAAAAGYLLPQTQQNALSPYTATVTSNGTFSKPIHIDASWRIGSTHTAYVYKQNGRLIKPLQFQIRSTLPSAHPGLLGCASQPASIVIGSAREGARQPISKTITLCTKGSGVVHWTARWDQQWLQLARSGQIQAPRSEQLPVIASALGLKHGMYRTSLVFTSQQSNAKIVISITFIVSQAPQPPRPSPHPQPPAIVQCISANPQALYFNAEPDQNSTLLQWVTIGNCGDTGRWSASAPTHEGGNWLGSSSSSGTLQRGGIYDVAITANSARLSGGTYTGHITFRIGSSTANVAVIFNVHQSICLNTNRQALAFAGVAGESDPSPQEIMLTNCGAAGHWSTLISTDDGGDWLHLSSPSYNLPVGGMQRASISASSSVLDKGEYHGKITFVIGSFAVPVDVFLLVSGPCLQPLPQSLTFRSTEQQGDPSPQRITISNCGEAAGQWVSSPSTDNGANWLSIDPPTGYLQKYATASVSISLSTAHLTNGIYTGQVLFAMGASIASVQVKLILVQQGAQVPDCIRVNSDSLSFTSIEGQGNPDPQTLTILNCGQTTGQWSSSIGGDQDGKWLTSDLPKGILGSQDTQAINVMPSSAHLASGTYKAQITFGIGSSARQVQVTLTVQPAPSVACINVDQSSLTFQTAETSSIGASYSAAADSIPNAGSGPLKLHINNCGDEGALSAAVSPVGDTKWLTTTLTDESLKKQAQTSVLVTAAPTGLIAGTYTGTIALTITTSTGTTATATVNVTLNILSPSGDTSGCMKSSPSSLTFTSVWGQDNPPAQNITLTNCGSDTSWTESDNTDGSLYLSSINGSLNHADSQTISIQQINGQVLPGMYTEPVTFTTADGATAVVNVTWNVKSPASPLCITPSSTALSFTMIEGGNTGELVDYFSNCGAEAGQISVGASGRSNWLTVGSLSGSSTNNSYLTGDGPGITADVNDTNLQPGTYTDSINATITTSGGSKQLAVPVTLLVLPQPAAPPDTGTPTATDTPTTSPTGQPTLQVSPTSFDPSSCPQNSDGSWTCTTTLSVDASSPGSVNWSASSPDLSGVTFSPSNDLLYPGQHESVAINVPASACSNGTFTFTTDAGVTSSASWKCAATPTATPTDTPTATPTPSPTSQPTPQVSPTSFDSSSCTQNTDGSWTCSATLTLDASAQSSVNWSASSPDLSGISFSPSNGTLSPGQQTPITITVPASDCSNGTFTFTTDSGATTSATWSCSASTPTVTPTDTPTDTPTAAPTDTPTDTPTPAATDTPTDIPPTDTPTPAPTDTPTTGP